MSNYRLLFMAIAVIALLSAMLVSIAARGTMNKNSNSNASRMETNQKGNSVMTIFSKNSNNNNSPNSNLDTKIYVNNKRVDVPSNGTLSKTYVDENGTTHINVQHYSSDSENGTSISTTTRVNTMTDSINK